MEISHSIELAMFSLAMGGHADFITEVTGNFVNSDKTQNDSQYETKNKQALRQ